MHEPQASSLRRLPTADRSEVGVRPIGRDVDEPVITLDDLPRTPLPCSTTLIGERPRVFSG